MTAEANLMSCLVELLSDDEELMALIPGGIHDEIAPRVKDQQTGKDCIVFPHIIIIINDDQTRNAIGTGNIKRVFDSVIFTLKCVDQSWSYETARQVIERVDALLAVGYNDKVLGFIRQDLVKFTETAPNPPYRHYGYLYKTIAKD